MRARLRMFWIRLWCEHDWHPISPVLYGYWCGRCAHCAKEKVF